MDRVKTSHRKRVVFICCVTVFLLFALIFRVSYLMLVEADFLQEKAEQLHNRERSIKAQRGIIYDRNGVPIAVNQSVTTISVIHNQITNPEEVIKVLSEKLGLNPALVTKKVNHLVSIEIIKKNVEQSIADEIRAYNLNGIMIDEDYRRIYPFDNLASHVIGFVGGDSQGIIGLEVQYDEYLKGTNGMILTQTNARGIEIENTAQTRQEPVSGQSLTISLDVNMQQYAEQALEKVLISKQTNKGSIILMNPQNGEIYAMVNKPDFDLNDPFYLENSGSLSDKEQEIALNQLWRNYALNDTYEPGSTFKVVTASAGLEDQVVSLDDHFFCPGYLVVEDRTIHCHKYGGHGSETFLQGVQNSCNPVFMAIGERLGVDRFLYYLKQFGLNEKTGIDLPGEAVSIMHKKENIGPVELATMSFGQSFQITPMQLIRAGAAVVNGGRLVTPHFGVNILSNEGQITKTFEYDDSKRAIKEETSQLMASILESVVAVGTGRNSFIPGYEVGGKTATSEKLPRSSNKYISSFLGFAPASNPQLMILVIVDEPQGVYYGGTVAAPVAKELFENILPYLGIEPKLEENATAGENASGKE
ncbi:MAG: peptidoglycan glycosyltransferase [Vallitaleaceae bacterium]|nr:peptidoglycan glycosyltransferase [Vallitaleaceae bacterium]